MIWYAAFVAIIVGVIVGLRTRNVGRTLAAGLITWIIGIVLSLVIVYSGLMGG